MPYNLQQFKKLSVPMHVIELESRNDCDEIQDVLGEITGARSVSASDIDLSEVQLFGEVVCCSECTYKCTL